MVTFERNGARHVVHAYASSAKSSSAKSSSAKSAVRKSNFAQSLNFYIIQQYNHFIIFQGNTDDYFRLLSANYFPVTDFLYISFGDNKIQCQGTPTNTIKSYSYRLCQFCTRTSSAVIDHSGNVIQQINQV